MLRLLDGAGAVFDQRRIALLLLLREGERRLRLRRLLFGLIDAGLLGGDLRIDIGHVGFGLIDLRDRLIDLCAVVAIIEPDQDRAGFDQLIVRHRHIDNGGAHLRADRYRAGVDKGVVGRFIAAGVEPIHHRRNNRGDDQGRDRENPPPSLPHPVEPRLTFADFADRRFGITSGSSVQAVFVIGALIHLGQMSGAPSGFCKRFGFAKRFPVEAFL